MLPEHLMPYSIIAIVLIAMAFFIWGRWRYDLVALVALAIASIIGAVPFSQVFTGLDNPAVITVACMMIISHVITKSNVINLFINKLKKITKFQTLNIFVFCFFIAFLSAFMNNVGALGLMLPVAIHSSLKHNRSPSLILMPIAMSSALGGMITLIGTPPNLIISSFRFEMIGEPFNIFDFSYVGFFTAIVGVIFIATIGWRFLVKRKAKKKAYKPIYTAEIRILPKSKWIDKSFKKFKEEYKKDINILGMIRRNRKKKLSKKTEIKSGDHFIIEINLDKLQELSGSKDFIIENQLGSKAKDTLSENILIETVVPTKSKIRGKSQDDLNLRSRFQASIIAISRMIKLKIKQIRKQTLQQGDMVLLQCKKRETIDELSSLGFMLITEPTIEISTTFMSFIPIIIFGISIILVAFNLIPIQVGFGAAVLVMILLNLTSLKTLFTNIDWSIIILLAAMIPIGNALENTGGAQLISNFILMASKHLPIMITIGLILVITMTMSDFINNAATAIVMAPIAITLAKSMGISVDPFLMAVAVGASCAFLTPIGHQNNLLVMGPGNYKFFDYIRIGLPLEIIVILVSTPLIYWFWYLK